MPVREAETKKVNSVFKVTKQIKIGREPGDQGL